MSVPEYDGGSTTNDETEKSLHPESAEFLCDEKGSSPHLATTSLHVAGFRERPLGVYQITYRSQGWYDVFFTHPESQHCSCGHGPSCVHLSDTAYYRTTVLPPPAPLYLLLKRPKPRHSH